MEVPTYAFLKDAIEGAEEGDTLFGAVLHDTVYETIAALDRGIRIGDCDADCAPVDEDEGEDEDMDEFDAKLTVVVFARVEGTQPSDRAAARIKARKLWLRVAKLFYGDSTMGGRVRDVLVKRGRRGFDTEDDRLYAVVTMPLLINGTGQLLEREENYS